VTAVFFVESTKARWRAKISFLDCDLRTEDLGRVASQSHSEGADPIVVSVFAVTRELNRSHAYEKFAMSRDAREMIYHDTRDYKINNRNWISVVTR